jgi:hypothetical protein
MEAITKKLTIKPLWVEKAPDYESFFNNDWILELTIGDEVQKSAATVPTNLKQLSWAEGSDVVFDRDLTTTVKLLIKVYEEGVVWNDLVGEASVDISGASIGQTLTLPVVNEGKDNGKLAFKVLIGAPKLALDSDRIASAGVGNSVHTQIEKEESPKKLHELPQVNVVSQQYSREKLGV